MQLRDLFCFGMNEVAGDRRQQQLEMETELLFVFVLAAPQEVWCLFSPLSLDVCVFRYPEFVCSRCICMSNKKRNRHMPCRFQQFEYAGFSTALFNQPSPFFVFLACLLLSEFNV